MLTAADIKSLHAEIPAVREALSSKLGTQLETGSSDEVRNTITQYVKKGNSAKTQAEGQAKARDIIKDAIPYAKKAVNEETGAEVAGIRQDAESAVDAQDAAVSASIDQAAGDQAAETTSRIAQAADQQAEDQKARASRDKRGNLNYREFSEQYRQTHPQAGNTEITEAYDRANREFKSKDTITIDGQEFNREEFKALMKVRGVNASNANVEQMFAASIASEQETGEKPHYSLSTLEDQLERKAVSAEAAESASTKAKAETAETTETDNTAQSDKTDNSDKLTETEAQEAYAGKSLTESKEIYSYYFMKNLPDMNVVELPSASELRNENGTINKANIVSEGMKNARSVGTERDGSAYVVTVKNRYTGRDIQVTSNAIRHGLNGSYARLATNAQLGSRVGTLIQNAVPVNALNNTAKSGNVTGTYAMAALTTDSEGRQVVAVITVEQRSNTVTGIESYDVAHAINGRKTGSQEAAGGSQADTRSQGVNPIKAAGGSEAGASTATVSVADFLDLVKNTHRSILSDDVLNRLNLERPADGYYTDRVRHSVDNAATETDSNQSLQSDQQSESKTDSADAAVEKEQENAKADKEPVENSPAPSGKYDESHPNKIAQWLAKETSAAIKALGVDNAEITIDYDMDKASNGYYLVKDGKRQIVLNGQLGGTTREGQVYSAQQNIRYVLGHELGHLVQGVGYTGDTNAYTRDILAVYQQTTGTTSRQVEAGVRDIMVRYMDEADRADSKLNISREDVTLDYAKGEYAANCLAEMLGDYNTLRKIARSQNRNIIQKAIDRVAKFRSEIITERRKRSIQEHEAAAKRRGDNAVVNVNGNVNDWLMIANLYDEAAESLEETLRDAMKNAGKMRIAEESNSNHYSLMAFEDGKRFVDVQADQSQFDGLSEKESGKLATKIIKSRFAGKVIGTDNRVFVNGRTASEYAMPSRKLNGGNYEAKMRASTELDNLIDAGTNFRTEADGKDGHVHPNMTGNFQYFDTIFKVGDEYYKGVINIMPVERGLLLKDITKIENVTQDTCSSYGENPKSTFLRDISMDSIRSDGENVNPSEGNSSTRYSLSDDTDETDLPGWDEDNHSKFDQFTDTYEKGTNLIGKSQSIQAAEELKREYGSRANTQSIAAKYRQMSTIAEQFSNVHLDGIMGEELLGKENRTRIYEEVQQQLMELGREVAERRLEQSILSPEVLEWAKHSTELDRIVARMRDIQKKEKRRVSQVRSNTYVFTLSVYYKNIIHEKYFCDQCRLCSH